ncbi:B12 binding domain protein [Kordia sp. SMS9]|uniref:KedN5 family methylcobalamin-dependent radical SAM C-methyltransferase n=1 Tax=Kordia sp. SMS9 TaxID=2282170 RepID=UPI000E104DE6|nr:KedN5 family methylcobalamin-dependent radical SAM C-methyltransferase [Kordia sp. SMS9]AXG70227.1 B12 binding domain protein [Kordia sp. SMS9]
MKKTKVALVHKGIWDMELLSMPLACGYIKAYAYQYQEIEDEFDIQIFNYGGGQETLNMIHDIVYGYKPDILAFSVYGWNYFVFGRVAETFKMVHPKGLVIMGGVHVAKQGDKVFTEYPHVDIIVNGEGEKTFTDLLKAYKEDGNCKKESINSISYRDELDKIITTKANDRMKDLNEIPSPFLTGAIPMLDEKGNFLYDAVTMESNRGCPYNCSFCYWGGATGAKLYRFDMDRIKDELTFFAKLKVENIALADANFGMIKEDEEIMDHIIYLNKTYGYPTNLFPSWAKNKGKIFYNIVKKVKDAGFATDFTLALQTLDDKTIELAQRKNMKINAFEDLCKFLDDQNMNSYAELIWQLPGETYDSFLEGYDKTAAYTSRIATYNTLLLPNTEYYENREKYGFVTFKNEYYDYESILSTNTMSYEDNVKMHHFLFWARLGAELMFFRNIFNPLRVFLNITQSKVLLDLNDFISNRDDDFSNGINNLKMDIVSTLDVTRISKPIRYLYTHEDTKSVMREWWQSFLERKIPKEHQHFFSQLYIYDEMTRAIHKTTAEREGLETFQSGDFVYYVSKEVIFNYDFQQIIIDLKAKKEIGFLEKGPDAKLTLYHRTGFENYIDNHEIVLRYTGKTESQVLEEQGINETTDHHFHVVGLPERA